MPVHVRLLQGPGPVADPRRGHGRLPVGRPALLRARPRAELPRGRRLERRLAGLLAARRRRGAGALRRRRRDHLHDRLLHRALAVARQPVRLPAAVLVLRDPRGVPGAAAVLGHRGGARAARPGDPRRRRADRAVPLRDLRARRAAARARLPDPPGRRRERRPGQEPDRAARAPVLPGHARRPRRPLVRRRSTASATSRRSSCAWRRSSPPTSRSRSTRSRPRSRSRATRC